MKKKLSFDEQLNHMKDKGIKFELVTEEEALKFIQENTYYFKLKAFLKNFMKDANNERYCNLDFKYLQDLSILDLKIRNLILDMTYSIEHYLKVELNYFSTSDEKEDGYTILKDFLKEKKQKDIDILNNIENRNSPYTNNLKNKYLKDGFAIWNFIELITFGEFISLYIFYFHKKSNCKSNYKDIETFLPIVRVLRNLSSHNNCFITNIANKSNENDKFKLNKNIRNEIKCYTENYFHKSKLNRCLKIQCIHDFIILLVVFKKVCSKSSKKEIIYKELYETSNYIDSIINNFRKNQKLFSSLQFLSDFLKIYIDK